MTFLQNGKRGKKDRLSQEWRIGEYVRLSKEDGDKPESDSIQNQHRIISNHIEYMKQQGEKIVATELYSDDGYPGGNFNRPAFQRMMRDIESGKINCVAFKDLSRLGRNYPELGKMMEDYFPQKGIRVISVLNNLDSVKSPETYCSAIVSFSNIVNDDYIRQLSIKIKSTLDIKRNSGEFIGNYAPYGYAKNPEDRHKLVIDPEAAEVVRLIFKWYAEGISASGITKQLNALHIITPSEYKTQKGCKGFKRHSSGGKKTGAWAITTVNSILRDEVYIGNLVQGKYRSVSYRSKKIVPNDPEDWIVVEGTHEPIISDEQFCIVHERFTRHTRVSPKKTETYLLSGMVLCGSCGRRLTRVTTNGYGSFRCPTRTYAPDKCQCPCISEKKLTNIILSAIQQQITLLVDAQKAIQTARKSSSIIKSKNEYTAALQQAEKEKQGLKEAQFRLYDNFQRGIIDQDEYEYFRSQYKAEILTQDSYIKQLQGNIASIQDTQRSDDEFVSLFEKFGNIQTLDRAVMTHLVDHVVVKDAKNICVYFKFSGECERIFDLAQFIQAGQS